MNEWSNTDVDIVHVGQDGECSGSRTSTDGDIRLFYFHVEITRRIPGRSHPTPVNRSERTKYISVAVRSFTVNASTSVVCMGRTSESRPQFSFIHYYYIDNDASFFNKHVPFYTVARTIIAYIDSLWKFAIIKSERSGQKYRVIVLLEMHY